ncbi:MAG: flippase [Treponema sp.]|nr:flippase [Treponema sp.]
MAEKDKTLKIPSVKKNFVLSTLYEILCIITPFITAPYVSRVLGAEQIGVNSFVHSIQAYFCMFATLGTATYGAREIARNRDNAYERSKLFWEIELLSIFTSGIALIGWIIFIIFTTQYKIYYIILTIGLFDKMFAIGWFYSGTEQFKFTVTRNFIVKIICIILVFTFVHSPDDLFIFILINSLCGIAGAASLWIPMKKFLVKVPLKELKVWRHLRETFVYFIPAVATSIYTVLDRTLIGLITHEESQNGFYEQANKIIHLIKIISFGSVSGVVGSRISYLFAHDKIDEIKQRIQKTIDFVMLIGIGSCAGMYGIANRFVPFFFGQGYDQVVYLLYILLPIVLIVGLNTILINLYFIPAGKRKQSSVYIIIGAVCNLIANLALIPRWKAYGASVGSIIAETSIVILCFANCNGFYSVKQLFTSMYKKLIAAVIMVTFLIGMDKFLSFKNWIVLAIQIPCGAGIYFISLLILRDKSIKMILELKLFKRFRKDNE